MVTNLGELPILPCNHIFLVHFLFLCPGKLCYFPFSCHTSNTSSTPLQLVTLLPISVRKQKRTPPNSHLLTFAPTILGPYTMDEWCSRLHAFSLNQKLCSHKFPISCPSQVLLLSWIILMSIKICHYFFCLDRNVKKQNLLLTLISPPGGKFLSFFSQQNS